MEPLDVASLLAEPAPLSWERLQATNGNIDDSPPADGDELDRALPWLVRHLGVADALALVMAADADAATAAGLPDAPAPGDLAVAPADSPADDEAFARALALAQAEARAEAEAQVAAQALAEAEALAAAEARALAAARDGIQAWPAEPLADDGLDLEPDLAHLADAGLLRAPPVAVEPGADPEFEIEDEATDDAGRLLGALGLIGFSGRLQVQALADLSPLQLPMLLLLRCGDACVLTRIDDRRTEHILHVVMPGQPPVAFDLPESALEAEYTGAALLLQRLDDDAPMAPPALAEGPLARLALALHAALSEPVPEPSRWRRIWAACKGVLGSAGGRAGKRAACRPPGEGGFKFAAGRPISG